jgi:hypothetical protein
MNRKSASLTKEALFYFSVPSPRQAATAGVIKSRQSLEAIDYLISEA